MIKRCSNCKVEKPFCEFAKDKRRKFGINSYCKSCDNLRKKKPLSQIKAKGLRLNTDTHKWCPSCENLLDRAIFYKSKSTKDGLHSECKSCHNQREINRRNQNPSYKLRTNVSRAIRGMLKNKQKTASCLCYLPYTPKQLKEHLENQFDENMSWDNYGSYWQVDHIHPQSLLPYDSMEHPNFIKCWALENLQPLEKIENIKKSNKIT